MSSNIPPLLCSTPPPIDFDDGGGRANANDDFETFESVEDAYGRFEGSSDSKAQIHSTEQKDLELPFSDFMPFPKNLPVVNTKIVAESPDKTLPYPTDIGEYDQTSDSVLNGANKEIVSSNNGPVKNDKSILMNDGIGFIIHDSPPSDVAFCNNLQSGKNSRDNSPISLEFCPENLSDDDSIDFQINESRYDDNTSLPSLKFDSINISKSATPVSEDKPIANQINMIEGLSAPEKENSVSSAFHTNELLKSSTEMLDSVVEGPKQDNQDNSHIIQEPNWLATDSIDLKDQIDLHKSQSCTEHGELHEPVDENKHEVVNQTEVSSIDFPANKGRLDDLDTDFHPFESCSTSLVENTGVLATINADIGSDEFSFEADFSQIDVPSVQTDLSVPQIEKVGENECSNSSDFPDDDFEDFQDFKAASVCNDAEHSSEQQNSTIHVLEGEDDDFGEFNDFKKNDLLCTAKYTAKDSIIEQLNLDDKLKGVLEMMFPVNDSSIKSLQDVSEASPAVLARYISLDLQEIDSAKALEYHWLQSNVKNSLVKSLGIDARNILYGEKWNTSMPRFAANLGLGPLEPLKPTKISYDTQSVPQSTKLNSLNSLDKPSTNSTSEVPTVKFDWNDAGLINPLDESHAHTLLLDLDQLVVVANLDKIKLDSSSPCSSASITRATTAASPTNITHLPGDMATAATIKCKCNANLAAILDHHPSTDELDNTFFDGKYIDFMRLDYEQNVDGFGDGDCIAWTNKNAETLNIMDYMTTHKSTNIATNLVNAINATNCVTNNAHVGFINNSYNDTFDRYLDCRVKEILHEGKAETIHSAKSNDTYGSSNIASVTENPIKNQQTTVGIIPSLPGVDYDLKKFDEIVDEQAIDTSSKNKPSYISDENYVKPSTIPPTPKFIPLKETHIYTPSKSEGTIARSVNKPIEKEPIDFDYEIAAAGIVINEQVVNKEYRDVVYNPESQDKNQVTFDAAFFQQEKSLKPDPYDPVLDPNKGFRHKSIGPNLLSQSIMNIIEKNEELSIQTVSRFDDEFSDFQENNPQAVISGEPIIKHSNSIAKCSNEYISPPHINSKQVNLDEEFTDFQSVSPPTANHTKMNATSEIKRNNKIESGEMILSPAILLPQAVKLESSEPKINWPSDSNIDPEELARLEQLFPQAKQAAAHSINSSVSQCILQATASPKKERKDDEDWSDFISVPPPVNSMSQVSKDSSAATPILSTISKAYDDDDWSEFVSGVPSTLSSASQPTLNKPWHMSPLPPPQFSSWHQPSTYTNLQSLATPVAPLPFAAVPPHNLFQQQKLINSTMPIIGRKDAHQIKLQNNNNRFSMNGQMNNINTGNLQRQHQQDSQSLHKSHHQQWLPQQIHQQTNSNANANFNLLKSQLNTAPSISLIPDLSFTTPKSLVQLSRASTNSKK